MRIVSGPGKSLWFGEMTLGTIVALDLKGRAKTYVIPATGASVQALAQGASGEMWFVDNNSGQISWLKNKGKRTEFKLVGNSPDLSNQMIESQDAAQWFATPSSGIGRITKSGQITIYNLQNNASQPTSLALGPDNEIWFAEWKGPNVGYVDTLGQVHEFAAGFGSNSNSFGIALGSDGRMWFCDPQNQRISAINTDGSGLTSYSTGLTGLPDTIVAGPDGNLYFGEFNGAVGMITTSGTITEYPLPITEENFPVLGITVGPDNNIWFANFDHAQVGMFKVQPDARRAGALSHRNSGSRP
jgi:virginiamycin B lyase